MEQNADDARELPETGDGGMRWLQVRWMTRAVARACSFETGCRSINAPNLNLDLDLDTHSKKLHSCHSFTHNRNRKKLYRYIT